MGACLPQVQRSRWLCLASGVLLLLATAGASAQPVASPPPASAPDGAVWLSSARAPLPSYFTVELGMRGALFADGRELAGAGELEQAAQQAAARGTFAGAVLFGDPRSGSTLEAVADVLRRAGFATLVEARRSAPLELSALALAERERARRAKERLVAAGVIEGDEPARGGASPARRGDRQRGSRVDLQSAGLHLAGPANTEAARRGLLKLFERNFPAFRLCHASAPEHTDNASFGVDLLVPKEGGRAKVRETRTRLSGTGFKACMERAFEAIRFEPPVSARPEIVSYSVLFKPRR